MSEIYQNLQCLILKFLIFKLYIYNYNYSVTGVPFSGSGNWDRHDCTYRQLSKSYRAVSVSGNADCVDL